MSGLDLFNENAYKAIEYENLYKEIVHPEFPFMDGYFNPVTYDIKNDRMKKAYDNYVEQIKKLSSNYVKYPVNLGYGTGPRYENPDSHPDADVLQKYKKEYTPSKFIVYAELSYILMYHYGELQGDDSKLYLRAFIDEENEVMFTYNDNSEDNNGIDVDSYALGLYYPYDNTLSFRENVMKNLLDQIDRDLSPEIKEYANLRNYEDYVVRLFSNIPKGFSIYDKDTRNFDIDASINAIINHFKYEKETERERDDASKRFGERGRYRTPEQANLLGRKFQPYTETTASYIKNKNMYDYASPDLPILPPI
ncbi:Hypothetical protein ORPV_256 [Orpheovirus IHUMI-LCC2]|uniref:Uncharacterized protein n=1 Tax=Orpheovirus IHUMI-LCC2 TaxID=2023057 RepID=A0A2I2L3R6_9VIRU|nr:Hypothetical protein ORPV_256 [Orpheovirus IHUMI-LCC2]SNW62160.1 Hypothetical protein ORPV_256 [Orpheovirus IHUMI-LCC2]